MPDQPAPYQPAEYVHPGATLAEWLERSGMTQVEFARRANLTPKHINQVLKGSAAISPEVALVFERVTSMPARYWTQLEVNYQAAKQRALEDEALAKHAYLVDRFPIKSLAKLDFVKQTAPKIEQLKQILDFFAVADPEALEEVWLEPALYRLSPAFTADQGALAAWLRLGEIRAMRIATEPFDAAACRAAIPRIRALSMRPGVDWVEPLGEICASVGIAIVIQPEFPKCRVNGATRWLSSDKAMILLSMRHKRNDIFWFTLFHELCHVLRHSKKETFVDTKGSDIARELEAEANSFASRTLIPPPVAEQLHLLSDTQDVRRLAKELGIAPGIIVGRMQHEKLIPPSQWHELFDRYRFANE